VIRRREFIAGAAGAAVWPLAARAQRPSIPVIGYLDSGSLEANRERLASIHRGLSETGYVEGRNLAIEYRWAEFHYDRLLALADDLVRRQVAVIFAVGNTPSALAAKAATKSIPIVFAVGGDPVDTGLVASLNRPGGNLTGIALLVSTVTAKRLEMLHQLVPTATSIAFLVNPTDLVGAEFQTKALQVAAHALGVRLLILNASDPSEFETAFATLVSEGAGGLLVAGDALFTTHSDQIVALAARHRVPAIYPRRQTTAEMQNRASKGAAKTDPPHAPCCWARAASGHADRALLKGKEVLRTRRNDVDTIEQPIPGVPGKPRYYVLDGKRLGELSASEP
jgi:putative ABC transport system substrate-binding protein